MSSRAAVWRRPAAAPLWAAAVALGAVALASLVVPAQATVAVTTTTITGNELPADLTAQVRGTEVCLVSAAPVRVAADPPTACVPVAGPTTQIRAERVAVRATSVTDGRVVGSGGTVTVAAGGDAPADRGSLDAAGRWLPSRPLAGRKVCLVPPLGWVVTEAPGACVDAVDGLSDVTFELEASP